MQWDLLPTLHELSASDFPLPENLDGGSLRSIFEHGNKGEVARPVEGLVFHYPCYFAPPLSVIRLGDYKLMEHLLTGEQKLFNVVADYQEKTNLIDEQPRKAKELKESMSKYLELIDAEDIQDVYQARFAELDRFESVARRVYVQSIKQAKGDRNLIADADARLAKDLVRFKTNREECRAKMRGKTF